MRINEDLGARDDSDAFEITIYDHASEPIVEKLGIKHTTRRQGESDVYVLEPAMPFWLSVDYESGIGKQLAWRVRTTKWTVPDDGGT